MCVSHEHKLCFVHIPRTGGVSICKALNLEEQAHRPASHFREAYPDYKIFTVMRPYNERMGSTYDYIKVPKYGSGSKDAFLMQALPTDFWLNAPIDYYIPFGTDMEWRINEMLTDLGEYPPIKLPHLNK